MNPKAKLVEMVLEALQRGGRRAVDATYESIPGRGAGHLEGIIDAPMNVKRAYTEAGSWTNPGTDKDVLYEALGLKQSPTRSAMGAYQPPAIDDVVQPFETNPARVARPRVRMLSGSADPEDTSKLDLAERVRGLMDVQNASAYHRTRDVPGGMGLRIPMTEGPLAESSTRNLADVGKQYGMGGLSDVGRGVTMFPGENMPPMQELLRGTLPQDVMDALGPDAARMQGGMRPTDPFDIGGYFELFSQKPPVGEGQLVRQTLGDVPEEMLDQLDNPDVRRAIAALLSRDERMAGEAYGGVRGDVQNMRRMASRPGGMAALLRAAQRGTEYLPAVAGMGAGYAGMRSQRED